MNEGKKGLVGEEVNAGMKNGQIGEYELTLSSTLYWLHDDPFDYERY